MEYWNFSADYSFSDNLLLRDETIRNKAAAFDVSAAFLFRAIVIFIRSVCPHGDIIRQAAF